MSTGNPNFPLFGTPVPTEPFKLKLHTSPPPPPPGDPGPISGAEANQLRAIIAALLFKLNPKADQRGVDVTITPWEIEHAKGWMLAVYTGIGIGSQPPLRVVMTRPHETVASAVVEDGEGQPSGPGQSPRALPPGS